MHFPNVALKPTVYPSECSIELCSVAFFLKGDIKTRFLCCVGHNLSLWAKCFVLSIIRFENVKKWNVKKNTSPLVPSSTILCVFVTVSGWIGAALLFSPAWSVKVRILYFSFYRGLKCCCSLRCAKPALPHALFLYNSPLFLCLSFCLCPSVSVIHPIQPNRGLSPIRPESKPMNVTALPRK